MKKMESTPFAEYREEQVKVNIFDYFVEPSFFDKFCDTKPIIISGSRGTGKTTILKALTLAEAKDQKAYLKNNNYIGVYNRIDLNVTSSFKGEGLGIEKWEKLFSYFFVAKMSYELILQFLKLKNEVKVQNEEEISQKYGLLFAGKKDIHSFEGLKTLIYEELFNVRNYINNCAYEVFPHIGDYATIIRELPQDLLEGAYDDLFRSKTIFYLVDEFEGLSEWQQRIILSFVKYADKYHTYKICMRPDGIKTSQTVGNEYIRETDDVRTIDLNELILENREDYYKYALDVCQKRIELFYANSEIHSNLEENFVGIFEELSEDDELTLIFEQKFEIFKADIDFFMNQIGLSDRKIKEYFYNNIFDFLICRLMYVKNNKKAHFAEIFELVKNKDKKYVDAVGNYKTAIVYYLCLRFSIVKKYSGFNTLVNISGGTLRYLLELCNEIFERAEFSKWCISRNPEKISHKIQTNAVVAVSNKRVNQISAIPEIGYNMRTFVISLGKIYRIFHRDERLAKFEPNHFSIKASMANKEDSIYFFLKECVMRGVLLKKKNNKNKKNYSISSDEFMYMLHPIYTPSFQISWRSKQKAEFNVEELQVLISSDSKEINKIIKRYESSYLKSGEEIYEWDCYQMKLMLAGDE